METIGIDAGNSRTKFGLFRNGRLIEVRIVENKNKSFADIPAGWKKIKPEVIALASVVPSANAAIMRKFGAFYGRQVLLIKPADCGMPLSIKNPGKVGVDRVLNCRAAMKLCGSHVIVVDAGTAVTIDAATEKEGFAGGSIIPGGMLWSRVLNVAEMIKTGRPAGAAFPGKSTDEAVSAGIAYGIPGAVNGILSAAMEKYPSSCVVLTGGGCTPSLRRKIIFDFTFKKYLTLEGIGLVLEENKQWK